ncbi:hypothetical protein [Mycolicibacterium septicum]|uniref:hypothetical protein n=1 Tax=Mycolicibacterium septicum TaxID=98668 RepID=UPI0023E0CB8D|nr:hypothetical protein [Mycolicibacterium septicum]
MATSVTVRGGEGYPCRIARVEFVDQCLCLCFLALRRIGAQTHVSPVLKFVDDEFVDPDSDHTKDDAAEHDHGDRVPPAAP